MAISFIGEANPFEHLHRQFASRSADHSLDGYRTFHYVVEGGHVGKQIELLKHKAEICALSRERPLSRSV
jgi:hypothetical protein